MIDVKGLMIDVKGKKDPRVAYRGDVDQGT